MEWMRTKRHRTRLVAWTQRHSSCDADANPRTKATGGGARDALEPLDAFQAAPFRSAVGLIGYIVLDRPDCQYAAKAVRSATTEPTKLSWYLWMLVGVDLNPVESLTVSLTETWHCVDL